MKRFIYRLLWAVLLAFPAVAAVQAQNVGIGTTTPDASALIDLNSSTMGLLIPRVSTPTGIASPANGLLIFNPTKDSFYYNAGSAATPNWISFLAGTSAWSLTGNSGTSPTTNFLGTIDNQDLVIKSHDTERIRVQADGNTGINTTTAKTKLDVNGDLALRYTGFTASNGTNNDIDIGAYSFARITGPTAAFTITGIAGGQDGKVLVIYNSTSEDMTIANDNASSTAANRILTLLSEGDLTVPGKGAVSLMYSAADSRWLAVAPPTASTAEAPMVIKRKASAQGVTSSTTLTDDNDLYFTLAANQVVAIDGLLLAYSGNSSPDANIAFTAPTGASVNVAFQCSWNGNANANVNVQVLTSSGARSGNIQLNGSNANGIFIRGVIANGSTAGTIHLQFSQNSSNSQTTYLQANSYLKVTTIQ